MQNRKIVKPFTIVLTAVITADGLAACGDDTPARSVEAFCSTMDKHKQRYLAQMDAANAGTLDGLLGAAGAVGDLKLMWKELADVAPSDIRTDAEAVYDTWKQQEEHATSGNWLGLVSHAVLNTGSLGRVDEYVRQHCN